MKKLGSEHLDRIIKRIRKGGRNKKYDVVLGVSGGADSCFAGYYFKKKAFELYWFIWIMGGILMMPQ